MNSSFWLIRCGLLKKANRPTSGDTTNMYFNSLVRYTCIGYAITIIATSPH